MRACRICHREYSDDVAKCPQDEGTLEPIVDPHVGQDLGGYVIESRLGQGGMSVVYQGRRTSDDSAVAIKILNKDLAMDPEQLRRVIEEARMLNEIRHPGICQFLDFGTTHDGLPYIAMELLQGEPLDVLMWRSGAMNPKDVIWILDGLLAAVGAAHAANVIHRDLKPGNVFVQTGAEGTRRVKVLDFGLARRVEMPSGTVAQPGFRASGTPEYMAPEQARGEKAGAAADLYSIGVIAFEMLTGLLPFTAPNSVELMKKHVGEPAPHLGRVKTGLPAPLERLVDELMSKEPQDRPQTAQAVQARLRKIERKLDAPRRPPWIKWALGIGLGLALAGGATWAALRWSSAEAREARSAPPR